MEALETPKRRRGRPKGSLNKATIARMAAEGREQEAPEEPEAPEPEEPEAPEPEAPEAPEPEAQEAPEPPQPPPKKAKPKQAPPEPIPPQPPVLSTKRRARKVAMASAAPSAPPSTPELTSDTFLEHLTKGLRSARELETSRRNAHYESFFQGFPIRS